MGLLLDDHRLALEHRLLLRAVFLEGNDTFRAGEQWSARGIVDERQPAAHGARQG
jgi:hypothetical protein